MRPSRPLFTALLLAVLLVAAATHGGGCQPEKTLPGKMAPFRSKLSLPSDEKKKQEKSNNAINPSGGDVGSGRGNSSSGFGGGGGDSAVEDVPAVNGAPGSLQEEDPQVVTHAASGPAGPALERVIHQCQSLLSQRKVENSAYIKCKIDKLDPNQHVVGLPEGKTLGQFMADEWPSNNLPSTDVLSTLVSVLRQLKEDNTGPALERVPDSTVVDNNVSGSACQSLLWAQAKAENRAYIKCKINKFDPNRHVVGLPEGKTLGQFMDDEWPSDNLPSTDVLSTLVLVLRQLKEVEEID